MTVFRKDGAEVAAERNSSIVKLSAVTSEEGLPGEDSAALIMHWPAIEGYEAGDRSQRSPPLSASAVENALRQRAPSHRAVNWLHQELFTAEPGSPSSRTFPGLFSADPAFSAFTSGLRHTFLVTGEPLKLPANAVYSRGFQLARANEQSLIMVPL